MRSKPPRRNHPGIPGVIALMPQFYFDVTIDEDVTVDDDGLDLPSLDAARQEAMMTAAGMARDDAACPKNITIRVRNGSGPQPVATVRLALTCEGPGAGRSGGL
jgi:hypothetical protein